MELNPKASLFFLASLITGYPHEQFSYFVETLLKNKKTREEGEFVNASWWKKTLNHLKHLLSSQKFIQKLRSDYIDIFDRGKDQNSPYETEYGLYRGMRKASELSDISGFYKAFGFECGVSYSAKEMLDHISVELEFYALLLMKQRVLEEKGDEIGIQVVLDARKKFLKDHLGTFIEAIASRSAIREHPQYHDFFQWILNLVNQECRALDAHSVQISWGADRPQEESFKCGVLGQCSIQEMMKEL